MARRLILLLQLLNVLELLVALRMTPRRPRFLRLSAAVVMLSQNWSMTVTLTVMSS